jgi:hypothetical protein
VYIGSGGGKERSACIGTREAEHPMTRAYGFLNDFGADEAGSPSNKNTHCLFSVCWRSTVIRL